MNKPLLSLVIASLFVLSSYAGDYWQQEVNYKIDVRLDDSKHELSGYIEIEYINHSPDELHFLYLHLWPNAYKNHNTAFARQLLENGKTDFYFSKSEERGWIDQLDFKVNNEAARWDYDTVHIDICRLTLNAPLKSGGKVTVTTPFRVKIPKTFSRLGHEGQSYQISQWYPKPAVYDKTGWHPLPYLDMGEFYSEYGSFDVKIMLPKNYVVGATGDLQNEEELKWLDELAKQTAALTTVTEVDEDSFPPSSAEMKTLHYKQNKVHDFAWFADKRYHVLKGKAEMPGSKRKVTTWTMFTNADFDLWKRSGEYINDAVLFYSKTVGEYPYSQVTAVQGALSAGGGMEYPNVTVIGDVKSDYALEAVIVHEVGHNWFYGIFGTHERLYPWMDEGINTYYENRYFNTKYEYQHIVLQDFTDLPIPKFFHIHAPDVNEYPYQLQAFQHRDQPMNLRSEDYTSANYWAIVYAKTALMINYLRAHLTTVEFDRVMQKFFDTWKFRHPQPADFRSFFEKETGKELDWFFDEVLPTTQVVDYKIKAIKDTVMIGKSVFRQVTIKNTGEVRGPYSLAAMQADTPFYVLWYGGFKGEMDVLFPDGKYDAFKINVPIDIPEVTRQNNTMRTRGMFRKLEPVVFVPLVDYDSPDYTEIYWSPVLGWNQYDRFMAGAAVYSNFLRPRNFEFAFVPMYSFGQEALAGTGRLGYYFYPEKGLFHHIQVTVNASMFSYNEDLQQFKKIAPEINVELRKKNMRSHILQNIKLRSVYLDLDYHDEGGSIDKTEYVVNELAYSLKNNRAVSPYNLNLTLHQGEGFVKTFAEGNFRLLDYDKRGNGLDARLFGGIFLQYDNPEADARFLLGGDGYNAPGSRDYLFDEVYFGRNESEGVLSRQVQIKNGGFKILTFVGLAHTWMTTLNLQSDFPGKIPFRLFFDAGIVNEKSTVFENGQTREVSRTPYVAESGITLDVGKLFDAPHIFEVHLPFYISDEIQKDNSVLYNIDGLGNLTKKSLLERLTFTVNLKKFIPFDYIRKNSP